MSDKQDIQVEETTESVDIRELSESELQAVAGGPQVLNDGPLT